MNYRVRLTRKAEEDMAEAELNSQNISQKQLDAEIQKGVDAMKAGKEKPFELVCAELKRDLEL